MKTLRIIPLILVTFLVLGLNTGCTTIGRDGEKKLAPLKHVPNGEYAKLKASAASPWTGSTVATAGDDGLTVVDGRATQGGYSVVKTTPFGASFSFEVELKDDTDDE